MIQSGRQNAPPEWLRRAGVPVRTGAGITARFREGALIELWYYCDFGCGNATAGMGAKC